MHYRYGSALAIGVNKLVANNGSLVFPLFYLSGFISTALVLLAHLIFRALQKYFRILKKEVFT